MKKRWLLKIFVPILLVLIVMGIWYTQSRGKEKEVTSGEFALHVTSVDLEDLSKHQLPILIDFGADACVPCKEMAPVLVRLNEAFQGKAIIQFVDVWKYPEAAADFPVQVIPTQVILNADGTPYIPSDRVADAIPFTMYSHRDTQEHVFTVHQGGLSEEQMRLILSDMGVE